MAMLAEPKRRQKWSLNPRGTLWSDDQNKFGQKLMEKMGWTKGEGLGKDGQGITDHIKAHHKDNNKGVGYKGKDDEWLKHYDAFENVLAALNSENNSANNSASNSPANSPVNSGDEDEGTKSRKSLEKRSKDSRARVHYHKFTRGKDLSLYKEDDLACILGSKRSKRKDSNQNVSLEGEEKGEIIEKETKEEFIGDEVGTTKNVNGVVTIAGGNYQEYFAIKMAALKKKKEDKEKNGNNTQNNIHGMEELSPVKSNEDAVLETKKSKKKKKKYKDNEDSFTSDNNRDIEQQGNDHSITCNDNSDIGKHEVQSNKNENIEKKKKHKKNKTEVSNNNMLEENTIKEDGKPLFGFEFSCGFTNGSTIKKYPFNIHNTFSSDDESRILNDEKIIKENICEKKDVDIENNHSKSKKKKQNIDQDSLGETAESKEKTKKKKSKDTINQMENITDISKNETSENACEEDQDALDETVENKDKKKKKKSKETISQMEDITVFSKNGISENACEEIIKKTKKKKNKNKDEDEDEKNNLVIQNANAIEFEEKEKVKKKKSGEETISNDCFPENTELKRKKKKNKNKLEDDRMIMEEDPKIKCSNNENENLNEKQKGKKRKREEEISTDDSSKSKKFKKNPDFLSLETSPSDNELKRRKSSKSKKSKKNTDVLSHELKRRKFWKKKKKQEAKRLEASMKKKKEKKKKANKKMATNVIQAFKGAKINTDIITKRDKYKLE